MPPAQAACLAVALVFPQDADISANFSLFCTLTTTTDIPQQMPSTMSRSTPTRQWFQPGEGIAREVITADIQRYLGPDALVKPGIGTGEFEVSHRTASHFHLMLTQSCRALKDIGSLFIVP